jgi:hypothetical protein
MNNRNKTVWVILIIMSVISIGTAGIKLYPLNFKWESAKKRADNLQFGADKELEGVIDFLEKRLQDRNAFNFTLEKEPLRLTNVLYLTDAQGRLLRYRNKKKLRVTHIIDGASTQYAGIQYRGENYTVVIGDSIAGGEVVWIDADEVVIIKGETEYHYSVAGLAEEENVTMENKTRNEY